MSLCPENSEPARARPKRAAILSVLGFIIASLIAVLFVQNNPSLRFRLANSLFQHGWHASAEAQYRAVLRLQERSLGAEHPDALTTRHNLGDVLFYQRKFSEAEAEFRFVLRIRTRLFGSESRDTRLTKDYLVLALQAQGKAANVENP